MATTVSVRFYVAGVAVGNTLSALSANTTGITNDVVLSGDPGLSVTQMQTAKARVTVTDGDGGAAISVFEITPGAFVYTPAGLDIKTQLLLLGDSGD